MFFSVKKEMKIGGKLYLPCICYDVTKSLEFTVEKLLEEGKVRVHSERVFFQNGKVIEKKEVKSKKKQTVKTEVAVEVKPEVPEVKEETEESF